MKAKLEIIGSMAAFGTIGAFVRHIPLPSGELALYRALIAAGAIFLWQLTINFLPIFKFFIKFINRLSLVIMTR